MFKIYADGVLMYDDTNSDESLKVVSPKLDLSINAAGSFTMTVPPTNVCYNSLERLNSTIKIFKDNGSDPYWEGRILEESVDFWNCKKITCEGALGYLNDTIQPQAKYHNRTPRQILTSVLNIHNDKVSDDRKILLGTTAVTSTVLPDIYADYDGTLSFILNKLLTQRGTYVNIRYENGNRYLDWRTNFASENSQQIEFGSNLFDFSRNMKSEDYCTVVVPRGAKLEEPPDNWPYKDLDAYTTVESVNNNSIYVTLGNADYEIPPASLPVNAYGWIEAVHDWDKITVPSELLTAAKDWLKNKQFDYMELEVSALDLHYAGAGNSEIKLYDTVRVVSPPHGLDKTFPVTKLEIPLDEPENSLFTLNGSESISLTKSTARDKKETQYQIGEIPTEQRLTKKFMEEAAEMIGAATTGYINIIQNAETGAEEFVVSNTPNYLEATRIWRWTMGGLGFASGDHAYENGTYSLALTADGRINADLISTGTLIADIIKAGILTDQRQTPHFWFNLETGEYYIKSVSDLEDELHSDYATVTELTVAGGLIETTVSRTYQTKADSGIVNLFPSIYQSEATSGNPRVHNGITWTCNPDGSVTAKGTASGGNSIYYLTSSTLDGATPALHIDPAKKYVVTGSSGGVYDSTYWLAIRATNTIPVGDGTTWSRAQSSAAVVIPTGYEYLQVYLAIKSGYNCGTNGVTFWPQLEVGETAHGYQSTHSGSSALFSGLVEAKTSITQTAEEIRQEASATYQTLADSATLNLVPSVYRDEHAHGISWVNNGITWTVNVDGTVTANGTASAGSSFRISGYNNSITPPTILLNPDSKYRLTGCPSNGSTSTYRIVARVYTAASPPSTADSGGTVYSDTGSGVTIPTGFSYASIYLVISSGTTVSNKVFKPMFERGSVAHPYQSTHSGTMALQSSIVQTAESITQTVSQTYQTIADSGIVNLLPKVYYTMMESGNPRTSNGITWTVNADGSVTAKGTATANSTFNLTGSQIYSDADKVPCLHIDSSKQYTVSGCTGGDYDTKYSIVCRLGTEPTMSSYTSRAASTGPVTLPTGYSYVYVFLFIRSGYACPSAGITFYPQLEVGRTANAYQSPQDGTGALGTKLAVAETRITQTANDITLEATRAQNAEDALSARINVNAEGIDLVAGKFEKIGSNNLFINTLNPDVSSASTLPKLKGQTVNTAHQSSATRTAKSHGFRVTNPGTNIRPYIRFGSNTVSSGSMNGLTAGATYTWSFTCQRVVWSEYTGAGSMYMRACLYTDSADPGNTIALTSYQDFATVDSSTAGKTRSTNVSFTFTVPSATTMLYLLVAPSNTTAANYGTSDYIEVRELTLVQGTVCAGWQPAADDQVGVNEIISRINVSPESITINSAKISLAGKAIDLTSDSITISSTNFSVTSAGAITATSGSIAGWTFTDKSLYKDVTISGTAYHVFMSAPASPTGSNRAFGVRSGSSTYPFSVFYDGRLVATNADITGKITATSGSFTGTVTATDGSFTGTITSTNASITGGYFHVTTSSDSDNRIVLTYNDYQATMAPKGFYTQNTSQNYGRLNYNSLRINYAGNSVVDIGLGGFVFKTYNGSSYDAYFQTTGSYDANTTNRRIDRALTNYGDLGLSGSSITASGTTEVNSLSVSNATDTDILSITLPSTSTAGRWLLLGFVRFTQNSTGIRRARIYQNSSGQFANIICEGSTQSAGSSVYTSIPICGYFQPSSSGATIKVQVYQNCGQALTVSAKCKAVRVV